MLLPNSGAQNVSPAITLENYPTLFTFAGLRDPVPVLSEQVQQDQTHSPQHVLQDPDLAPPNQDQRDVGPPPSVNLRPRDGKIDYQSLHAYGKAGQDAWKST